ncbi:hypothetical protein HMPREF9012_2007 [Bacteroidetes bacterium oral taxon 272 str. F0290]|nr:hypothetical protein HMPREF9012_2007 [Bacteroidetes bacterium oral taxon 272 str. F0290]
MHNLSKINSSKIDVKLRLFSIPHSPGEKFFFLRSCEMGPFFVCETVIPSSSHGLSRGRHFTVEIEYCA